MQDYRFSPFQNITQPVDILNELHAIPTTSPFEIRLNEIPVKDNPSSLSIRVCDVLTAITSTTATSITVANGSWFSTGKVITIDSEKMLVTAVAGNTLTVTRGYQGTTATTHSLGAAVYIENSMAEVSSSPGPGQFWPDYSTSADNDPGWNTGTIQFNSADGGKIIAVTYRGLGGLVDSLLPTDVPWHLRYLGRGSQGDFVSNGNISLGGEYHYKNFTLLSGHTITVPQTVKFLTLRCTGVCVISGTLSAKGAGATGALNSTTPESPGNGGGGGGTIDFGDNIGESYCRGIVVANQAQSVSQQYYDMIINYESVPPTGAGGSCSYFDGSRGGNGGGFIQIVAREIVFTGIIDVRGNDAPYYGGGGGGGVAIMVARRFAKDTGVIKVSGGAGANGGTSGGAGWYKKFIIT